MSQTDKNRVASSKTTRGSQSRYRGQHPNKSAGHAAIIRSAPSDAQPVITVDDVNRVLQIGYLLRSVLTPTELERLHDVLSAKKRPKCRF
jgi:hypothetical protein